MHKTKFQKSTMIGKLWLAVAQTLPHSISIFIYLGTVAPSVHENCFSGGRGRLVDNGSARRPRKLRNLIGHIKNKTKELVQKAFKKFIITNKAELQNVNPTSIES